jgi:hypothetical protein
VLGNVGPLAGKRRGEFLDKVTPAALDLREHRGADTAALGKVPQGEIHRLAQHFLSGFKNGHGRSA